MTTQKELLSHTPDGPTVIKGVALKDAKRMSRWPAILDVAQSVTGLVLGLFLFCHMAFTSSFSISKDLFYNLCETSGLAFLFGSSQGWAHFVFVAFIMLFVIIHAITALRRFPTSYRQCRDMNGHISFLHHTDSTLWLVQLVTAVILTGMAFPHMMHMLTAPENIDPNLSAVRAYDDGIIWTLIFLVATELHGMIGLYRLGVKWDVVKGDDRSTWRKFMLCVCALMIVCGAFTSYNYWSHGRMLVDTDQAATRYVPETSWYAE